MNNNVLFTILLYIYEIYIPEFLSKSIKNKNKFCFFTHLIIFCRRNSVHNISAMAVGSTQKKNLFLYAVYNAVIINNEGRQLESPQT